MSFLALFFLVGLGVSSASAASDSPIRAILRWDTPRSTVNLYMLSSKSGMVSECKACTCHYCYCNSGWGYDELPCPDSIKVYKPAEEENEEGLIWTRPNDEADTVLITVEETFDRVTGEVPLELSGASVNFGQDGSGDLTGVEVIHATVKDTQPSHYGSEKRVWYVGCLRPSEGVSSLRLLNFVSYKYSEDEDRLCD